MCVLLFGLRPNCGSLFVALFDMDSRSLFVCSSCAIDSKSLKINWNGTHVNVFPIDYISARDRNEDRRKIKTRWRATKEKNSIDSRMSTLKSTICVALARVCVCGLALWCYRIRRQLIIRLNVCSRLLLAMLFGQNFTDHNAVAAQKTRAETKKNASNDCTHSEIISHKTYKTQAIPVLICDFILVRCRSVRSSSVHKPTVFIAFFLMCVSVVFGFRNDVAGLSSTSVHQFQI